MITWQDIIVSVLLVWNMVLIVANIGKPREPITPKMAAATVVVDSVLILLVITG
jgi:hypothetical protein